MLSHKSLAIIELNWGGIGIRPCLLLSQACGITILTVAELRLVHISSAVALQVLGTLHQIPLVITGVVFFQDSVGILVFWKYYLKTQDSKLTKQNRDNAAQARLVDLKVLEHVLEAWDWQNPSSASL